MRLASHLARNHTKGTLLGLLTRHTLHNVARDHQVGGGAGSHRLLFRFCDLVEMTAPEGNCTPFQTLIRQYRALEKKAQSSKP